MSSRAMNWRAVARTLQTHLPPPLHEYRLDAQQWVNRCLHRPHEREFRDLDLPAGACCLDAGANRGQSIDSLRLFVPDARIWAFEPQRRLAWRLMNRYPDVRVVRAGVGESPVELTLYTPSYRGYRFDGLASTSREAAVDWFRYALWHYDPDLLEVDTEVIRIVRLDDLELPKVDFLKLDVQGMELAALRGAEQLLRRDHPVVMVETPDEPVTSFLGGLGYERRYGGVNVVFTRTTPR